MSTDYRPGLREIASEMERIFSFELRELYPHGIGKSMAYFGKGMLEGGLGIVTTPYAIPTVIRHLNDLERLPPDTSEMFGVIAGGIYGVILDSAAISGYVSDPKYLAIPIATNAISFLYEWVRRARNHLIEIERGTR
ncbi:MAG: hypothetical protein HYW22_00775 [Candidatus Aenigmarchaeota archaeon]|nr:hypothetical protein [Candidatus Aenigmarchaeota archaeon]